MEMPESWKRFKLWRGYPVHYTVFVDDNGVPDFKAMHEIKRIEAFGKSLCHLCGKRLTTPIVLIGGPYCVKAHQFIDGPMHEACARYAAFKCPFLNGMMTAYSKTTGEPVERPEMFLCLTESYEVVKNPGRRTPIGIQADSPHNPGQWTVKAGPWLSIEKIEQMGRKTNG